MGSTGSSTKRLDSQLHKWLVRGAAILLSVIGTGLVPVAVGLYQSTAKVESNDALQDQKIVRLEDENKDMKKQLGDIHWYLIKRNNVKVPENESEK